MRDTVSLNSSLYLLLHIFLWCVVFSWWNATLFSKKNSEILSIHIDPPTRFGGWPFLHFTSSPLDFIPLHTHSNTNSQNTSWKLESENRNWEIPVLFVFKMKIRHAQYAEWRKVQLGFSTSLFLLYILTQCKKNP